MVNKKEIMDIDDVGVGDTVEWVGRTGTIEEICDHTRVKVLWHDTERMSRLTCVRGAAPVYVIIIDNRTPLSKLLNDVYCLIKESRLQ